MALINQSVGETDDKYFDSELNSTLNHEIKKKYVQIPRASSDTK